MLDALRFVASAVAKKDFVPELTHFKIKDGRVTGFNGVVGLSAPIGMDINTHPNATELLAAVRACNDTIALNMTPSGKLHVKSGKFKAFVNCLDKEEGYFVEPEGEDVELDPSFLDGLKALSPMMGFDASRPWAMGVLLDGQSMLVTNNVMLGEYWVGTTFPRRVVLPAVAIEELLRIDEEPVRIQMTENSITFWFEEDRWLRSALVEAHLWPLDQVKQLLDKVANAQQFWRIETELGEAAKTLKPFLEERTALFIDATGVSTSSTEGVGARIDFEQEIPIDAMQAYHQQTILLLCSVAVEIDWSTYPAPCPFRGPRLRGAIIGQRI